MPREGKAVGREIGASQREKMGKGKVESTDEGTLGRDAFIWTSAAEGSRAVMSEVGRERRR